MHESLYDSSSQNACRILVYESLSKPPRFKIQYKIQQEAHGNCTLHKYKTNKVSENAVYQHLLQTVLKDVNYVYEMILERVCKLYAFAKGLKPSQTCRIRAKMVYLQVSHIACHFINTMCLLPRSSFHI